MHVKISDIDTALMLIHVHQGKGSRDRDATHAGAARGFTRVLAVV